MSSISTLSNWQPASRYAAPASGRSLNPVVARLDAAAGTSPPSTIVALSPEALAAAAAPVSTGQRYHELGADILKQLGTGSVIPPDHTKLPDTVDNRFGLSVTTRSGAKLELTLANMDDEMIFQVSSSAELKDDERKALAGLADAFQAAIDGMAEPNPQVRLGGLTRFDHQFVQSIDFHAEVKTADATTQTLDFSIDDARRKVSIGGPDGKAEVNVDTGAVEHVGTRQQQAKAINNYLAQFDQAVSRGHGDKRLMAMFKDAFSDMNRTATSEERKDALAADSRWQLNSDRSTLTGLSDFSASVTQTPTSSNPRKPLEQDNFSYDVSQSTTVKTPTLNERAISQSQQSHLGAQFHTAIEKSSAPFFDGTPQTQNYEYHQIDDSARSNVSLNFRDGKLNKATLEQMANQSERVQTFLLGKLTKDKTTPSQQSLVRDLLPSLTTYERYKTEEALNDNIFLLGSPGELVARNEQF
ncbi:hypothetical protein [Duganella sp. Root336D2]|uniref:hypothetical protein n=1 Tax=Duganella sp. Root336D2 TaxID=1736518 RepID=UPI0006F29D46|nr:hypothetical protein [Duganella sp. Root336D2]KQV61453.1 hypothetical protein ASD07_00895 [Duganella sp. Root336D2]